MDPDESPSREQPKASQVSKRESKEDVDKNAQNQTDREPKLPATTQSPMRLDRQNDDRENKMKKSASFTARGEDSRENKIKKSTSQTGKGDVEPAKAKPSGSRPSVSRATSVASYYVDNPKWRQKRKSKLLEKYEDVHTKMSVYDFPHSNINLYEPDLASLCTIDLERVPWWTSQRVLLSIICFFGFIILYAQRVNISIAIVSMVVDETLENVHHRNMSLNDPNCPDIPLGKNDVGELRWDQTTQGMVLGSFYWGYTFTQVPGGWIGEKFGARRVITYGMLPVAVLTILGPIFARWDPYLFIATRVMLGLGSGVMYPAVQALWTHWAPPNERSRLLGFAYAGGQFGSAITFPVTGYMIAGLGWTSAFYIIGSVGLFWVLIWFIFAADNPDQSRFISRIEKNYIKACIGDRARNKSGSTPWYYILTSKPVWAIILAHMFSNYGSYMLLAMLPTYFKEVLHMDIKSNGLYSSLPFFLFWILINVSAVIADWLISTKTMSILATRKLMTTLGLGLPGLGLIGVGFMRCDQPMGAIVLMTLTCGFCGFRYSGFFVNHGDIAPPFAGTLFGMSNMAAAIPGFLAPAITKALTYDGTREQWQLAFYVGAVWSFAGVICYLVLAEGEIQWWAAGTDISLDEMEEMEEMEGMVTDLPEDVTLSGQEFGHQETSRCPLICGCGDKVGISR